ncbi:hypothetical protein J6S88_07480 [bacterium]|nr:hypothetical protein [bacterium]
MAASQARFLGLTARLNNVEFEAQQIHQQRTSLSNKSASYYSDLLGLSVPVAPSVDAYTKTVYTFDDGALSNQITSMIASSGTYTVSYLRTWDDDFAVVAATPRIVTKSSYTDGAGVTNDAYSIGSDMLRKLDTWNVEGHWASYSSNVNYIRFIYNGSYTRLNNGAFEYKSGGTWVAVPTSDYDQVEATQFHGLFDNERYTSLTAQQLCQLSQMEHEYISQVQQETGTTGDVYVRYVQNTTTGEYEPVFFTEEDLITNATYDPVTHNSISNINAYKIGTKERIEEVIGVTGCHLEQDSTGRFINIEIPNVGKYALTTNTVTDQAAYDDAMNQYEYDKAIYEQSIADINAKIEIVQAEDKNLELHLKQLDTEHNAIQTERDQVKELIKKNVDNSFKTFG